MIQKNRPFSEPGDKTVFKMPENYFENFEAALEKRLDALEAEKASSEEKVQTDTRYRRLVLKMENIKPVLYMAAMFVLLIFSVSLVLNLTSGKSSSSLRLSAESTTPSTTTVIPTAEDYLINSIGTYGISEYYVDSESFE